MILEKIAKGDEQRMRLLESIVELSSLLNSGQVIVYSDTVSIRRGLTPITCFTGALKNDPVFFSIHVCRWYAPRNENCVD